jgi:hypothetical protein
MKSNLYDAEAEKAKPMTNAQIRDGILTLARTGRLAPVIALLERDRESWEGSTASQDLAAHPGKLTHSAGSLFAVRRLLESLRTYVGNRREEPSPTPGD